MAKNYLAMIADIKETDSGRYERNVKRVKSLPVVTPASILAAARYGSLTHGGLRDALRFATGCSLENADIAIGAAIEAGAIAGPDENGLYWVRQ